MKKLHVLGAIILFLICGNVVQAHPHRHHHHMRVPLPQPRPFQNSFFSDWFKPWPQPQPQTAPQMARHGHTARHYVRVEATEPVEHDVSMSRPSDCYGIAWCGCFLRHYFGLADRALNSAFEWTHVGHQTTAHNGAIVVWRHHVGILRSEPVDGRALVLSGNDGHRVRLRAVSLSRVIAYREM